MNDTLYSVLIGVATFIPFFVILLSFRHPKSCPDCGRPLPRFISPFKMTKRHWIEGGCICPGCGCDVDTAGRKVPTDSPLRLRPLLTAIVMLTLIGGLAVVLLSFVLYRSNPT